ncbi:MAG: LamG-like jellyroll fold domain-containing protein [Pseudomonadota bacterium]
MNIRNLRNKQILEKYLVSAVGDIKDEALAQLLVTDIHEILFIKDEAIAIHLQLDLISSNLLSYLDKLLQNKNISQKILYNLVDSLGDFVNSRDCLMPGRYEKIQYFGFDVVKTTLEFKNFKDELSSFKQRIQYSKSSSTNLFQNLFISTIDGLSALAKNPVAALLFLAQYNILLVQAQESDIPRDGLVAEYLFDSGSALDTSGHQNHGIVFGASPTKDLWDVENNALYFDGGAYVTIDADDFPTKERTVSMWIKPDIHKIDEERDRGNSIFGYGGSDDPSQWRSMIVNLDSPAFPPNTLAVQSHNRVNLAEYHAENMHGSPSDWVHLAITNDKHAGLQIYWNNPNQPVTTSTGYMKDTYVQGKKCFIGAIPGPNGLGPFEDNSATKWVGIIDNVRVYNRLLKGYELVQLFNEKPKQQTNLMWTYLLLTGVGSLIGMAVVLGAQECYKNYKNKDARLKEYKSEVNKALDPDFNPNQPLIIRTENGTKDEKTLSVEMKPLVAAAANTRRNRRSSRFLHPESRNSLSESELELGETMQSTTSGNVEERRNITTRHSPTFFGQSQSRTTPVPISSATSSTAYGSMNLGRSSEQT